MKYFDKTHISNIIQIKMARYEIEIEAASRSLASIAPTPRAMYKSAVPTSGDCRHRLARKASEPSSHRLPD
jgi:hypothetical protein